MQGDNGEKKVKSKAQNHMENKKSSKETLRNAEAGAFTDELKLSC